MASITKAKTEKGEIRYRVRVVVGYKPDGSPIQKMQTFDSRRAGESWSKAVESGQALAPAGKLRLGDYLAQWQARAAKRVRPSTMCQYGAMLTTHILPQLGGRQLADLTRASLQAWIDGLPSPSAAAGAHAVLHAALAEAVDLELIATNPAHRLKLPRRRSSVAASWSREEARAFLAAAAGAAYSPYWLLATRLALRPSELLALRWANVDLERGSLTVMEARPIVGTKRFDGPPKSASGARTLDLPADIVGALRAHKSSQAALRLKLGPSWPDLVCTNLEGQAIYYKSLWRVFRSLCAAAGVPVIRLYDLRHTAISLMAEAGADFKAISEVAGHADVRITRNVYQHVNRSQRRAALAALGDALEAPISAIS